MTAGERELHVAPERAGERLDHFLADSVGSRARAQRLIEQGRVAVDGAERPKSYALPAGATVAVCEDADVASPGPSAATPAVPFTIVYQDEHLLVVDKPAGLVVHPARGHWEGTLAQALAGVAGGGEEAGRAGIVHRLDRDTSGLILVARTDDAHRRLRSALAERHILREYLALVEGRPPARAGTIDAPIGRDRRVRTRMSIDTDAPREARTHFEFERALPSTTLLRVRLETGRTHQIRVHLQAIGHPVVGDPEYGGAMRFGLERQFLHAARLALTHPITGAALELVSPLPDDLSVALARAEDARPPGRASVRG